MRASSRRAAKMPVCRLVPTPTGWTWAPDNRPWSSEASEQQCVFAVEGDCTVPSHTLRWQSMGHDMDEIPNAVHRAILHLDRKAGTAADVDALVEWVAEGAAREGRARRDTAGRRRVHPRNRGRALAVMMNAKQGA